MATSFDPDKYFHNNEWKSAIDPSKNHYERLGLRFGEDYSSQNITKSFQQRYDWWREVNKRYNANPANTKTKETGPASVEAMGKLQEAYAVLTNSSKKSAYDKQLLTDSSKKAREEFIKMVRIVASDNALTQEGEKILLNYADTLGLSRTTASGMITAETERMGGRHHQSSTPTRPFIVVKQSNTSKQRELPDYYALLEIDATAGDQEILDAYKRKVSLWESLSSNPKFRDFALRRISMLREAVAILLDRDRRRRYDYELYGKGKKPVRKALQGKSKTIAVVLGGAAMVITAAMIAVVLNKGKSFPPPIVTHEPYISKNEEMHEILAQEEASSFYPGWLGATIQEIDPALAEAFGVDITEGVIVTEALNNSPAEYAGLRSGDIIVEFDGAKLQGANHLNFMVEQTGAGKHAAMKIIRDRKETELNVILGERPAERLSAKTPETIPPEKNIGIMVQNIPKNENGSDGVLVIDVHPESPAAKYNIEKGDIITEINRNKISTVVEFIQALVTADAGEKILLHIKKGDISLYLTIDPAE